MSVFVDTNVFIASITDEPERGRTATTLLNRDHEFQTSLLNLMEVRSVLSKKKRTERGRIETLEDEILRHVDLVVPDTADMLAANRLQEETLLYPMDCLVPACANGQNATLTTFDSELLDAGAVPPSELLE